MCVHAGIPRNTKPEAIIHIPRGSNVKKNTIWIADQLLWDKEPPRMLMSSFNADHLLLGMEPTLRRALYFQ